MSFRGGFSFIIAILLVIVSVVIANAFSLDKLTCFVFTITYLLVLDITYVADLYKFYEKFSKRYFDEEDE